ncbi:MAG: rRNA pseudouridine synthase [Clostridiales bacterium]|nr:rRNA pseudouridine synthase [Clostridiales bacterium]
MKERLQKILSRNGVASRRGAEKLIAEGAVEVNGVKAVIGQMADPEQDIITVHGKYVGGKPEPVYIALYKPRGYVTTLRDERGRKTVRELVSDCGAHVYPAGRLDMDSEGLLILTNDGEVAHKLMHPSREVKKVYRVTVDSTDDEKIEMLRQLTELDGEPISSPEVRVIRKKEDRSSLEITIHEGKKRQIRRMCEQVGMEVLRLKRNKIGEISLGMLKPGEWRYLDKREVRYLKSL